MSKIKSNDPSDLHFSNLVSHDNSPKIKGRPVRASHHPKLSMQMINQEQSIEEGSPAYQTEQLAGYYGSQMLDM